MRSNKSIAKLRLPRNIVLGLSTISVWLMAAYGWKLAVNIAKNHYRSDGEINTPSFYLTLLVLPLPYVAFQLHKYLVHKYPAVDWTARLASSVFYVFIITLALQVLILCPLFLFIGMAGGGLDIMFSWKTDIILDGILWGTFVTFLTVLITFSREKDIHFLLLSLPAVITYGIFFFTWVFLAGMSAKVLP
jgi:hypothetical protein